VSSKLIESLRSDLAQMQRVGAISKVTMRQFDALCPPPVREFSAHDTLLEPSTPSEKPRT
jgi:putative transcriptional regulator